MATIDSSAERCPACFTLDLPMVATSILGHRERDFMTRHSIPDHSEARRSVSVDIGETARASGVSSRMIRHYEAIGLVPPAGRTCAGYRIHCASDVHRLRFVKRARDLGFNMEEIAKLLALLALWKDRRRKSSAVKRLALRHAPDLERKISELEAMRRSLMDLAHHCHGDQRPECPILDDLSAGARR
jgi:Cu(I)-responsive transcriptional regulator